MYCDLLRHHQYLERLQAPEELIPLMVHGFGDKERESRGWWSRGFRIDVGALEIAPGILVLVSLATGVAFVAFIFAIELLSSSLLIYYLKSLSLSYCGNPQSDVKFLVTKAKLE